MATLVLKTILPGFLDWIPDTVDRTVDVAIVIIKLLV
jgi:hypothetical protein